MTIKDILVPMDHAADCSNSLEVSVKVAEQFDAHITGLHITSQPSFEVYGEIMTPGILSAIEEQHDSNTEKTKNRFENYMIGHKSKSSFISVQGIAAQEIMRRAATQDIVIVDQFSPGSNNDMTSNIPEQVALESGRPALIIPYIGCRGTIGKNILIAWNNKREAVRAVHDAMPFLCQADSVKVIAINTGRNDDLFCADIGEHLARHNVNVEIQQIENTDIRIADNLLSRAADFGTDMLVMGAYGHSRFREYTLGGVTRTILKTMTVPVLLSH